MQDFYQRLEHLVYSKKYTNSLFSKESALMCIHATLSQRENIPRIYIPLSMPVDSEEKQTWIWDSVVACLFSDHKAIYNWTVASLKLLHISNKEIIYLSNDERLKSLNLIEENLENNIGCGKIYYETSRFTPFCDDDIYEILLLEESTPMTIWQSSLFQRLKERAIDKIKCHHKHANLLQNMNLRCDCDMFHNVYKFKLEQVWQSSWLNLENYKIDSNIINTIIVGESFED